MLTHKKNYFLPPLVITVSLILVLLSPISLSQASPPVINQSVLDLPAEDAANENLLSESSTLIGKECIPSNLNHVIHNTCLRFQQDASLNNRWAENITSELLPLSSTGYLSNECIPTNMRRVIPNTCLYFQQNPSTASSLVDYTTSETSPNLTTEYISSECIPSNLRRAIPNTCLQFQTEALAAK